MARARTCKGQGLSRAIKGHQGPMSAARDCCQGEPRPIFPLPSCNAVLVSSRWQIDGHLASPGITWHHLAIAPNEHRVVIGCHRLSMLSVGCQWNQWMPCMSASLLPRPQVYRDLSDAKAATYGASAALGESWWILVNLGGWCDHPDESWWISGLTRTVSGGSADWAQVQTWLKCTGPAPISRRHKMTWPIDRAFCLILKLLSSRLCLAVPLRDLNWLIRSYKKIEGT